MTRSSKCGKISKANGKGDTNHRKQKKLNPESAAYFPVRNNQRTGNEDEKTEDVSGSLLINNMLKKIG